MLSSLEIQNVPVLAEILNAGIDRRDKDDDADDEIERVGAGHGHHQDQADHRAGRLDLAAPGRGDDAPIADSDEAQTGDCKLACDDNEHDPAGHAALADKDHHAGRDQQLVGQRIEELAEIRDLIIMARDVAVDKIADARDHEHAERRPAQRVIPAAAKQ